jgi:hypothetical protein
MTTEALPAGMLARLEALGAELIACAREHRDAPLAKLEQAVLARVRAAQGGLLEEVVERSTTSLRPQQARVRLDCPGCGERAGVQDWRTRRVRTVLGRIRFERPWYVCGACRHGWSPTDATLELEPRARLSVGLQEWVGEVGAETAFRQGRRLLARLTGQQFSKETIRRHSQRQGAALAAAQVAASAQVLRTREAAEPVDRAPGHLLVEADGVLVRYLDGWHEVKVGLVAGYVDGELVAPSYVAAREAAEAFGHRLLAEAARRGALEIVAWKGGRTGRALGILRRAAILGDGAPWIWTLAGEHFGERIEIVDFYHALEHLWVVARALHGADSPAGTAWAEARRHELRHQGAAPVRLALRQTAPSTAEAREAVRLARGYFRTNADRMAYPTFRAAGLPIGSGAVEASAKHLVQQRMKRAGMRWSEPGARAMLALLAHRASGRAVPASAFLTRPQPRSQAA